MPERTTPEGPIRFAVLASGSGTNFQALIDSADPMVEFSLLISDRAGAGALRHGEAAEIPTAVVAYSEHPDREGFSIAIVEAARASGAEVLVLAGFMRVLSPVAVNAFPDRILNIHPSLLPAFPGARAVAQALAYGAKVTGVTVHFVDEEVDHGPIIAQRPVPVLDDDTVETLHERIQIEEHKLYPEVISAFARGRIEVVGREVVWR
ncbi:MAG TPA: phosphoribosylglycinamide formyltransferase [Acidimicrobiia bacterium]|nr:phosphoribosylglycinamide formyltransferase [Acidimicrobiia bacterium]